MGEMNMKYGMWNMKTQFRNSSQRIWLREVRCCFALYVLSGCGRFSRHSLPVHSLTMFVIMFPHVQRGIVKLLLIQSYFRTLRRRPCLQGAPTACAIDSERHGGNTLVSLFNTRSDLFDFTDSPTVFSDFRAERFYCFSLFVSLFFSF